MHPRQNEDPAFLHTPRPCVDTALIVRLLREHWGIDGHPRDLGGDRDQNLVIDCTDGERYLLKIAQTGEDPGVIDLQLAALEHIAARDPTLPVPRVIRTRDDARTFALPTDDGVHLFRVFNHLPGKPVIETSRGAPLLYDIGTLLARVDDALQGYFHPHAGHELLWDIRQAPSIRKCADDIDDPALRKSIQDTLDHFVEKILPALGGLRAQIIHGDATAENVLGDGSGRACGLIDFGDIVHAPRCQEIAMAMADVTRDLADPWSAACVLATGYDEVSPLPDEEIELLWDMCCARLALTLAIMESRAKHREEGLGSMEGSVASCRQQYEALVALGAAEAGRRLRRALRAPQVAVPDRAELLQRRQQRLMPGLALFYPEDPLHVVRGEGVWLIDAAGKRHLDCYNNVPQVGHAHPHVAHAIARQTATLNTNTRYVYDTIVEYADALAERLPGELGVALFVNSGSEANDLAWRIARACTGASGALITNRAYHGGTVATDALSVQDGIDGPDHVARLPVAPLRNEDAQSAIAALNSRGHDLAAFMIDPVLASDGILDPPHAWFESTAAAVRAAGGLCISDEVQSGFGRLGTWWGFEARGFTPDIVTLGKPVANGYPMGVVVTTPEIMAAFAEGTDYFSTFGGNPVACIAGLAVIDVIEREGLCRQAEEVGTYLRTRLGDLQARHGMIGEVRGRGLFVGVELVREGAPATGAARTVALALRHRGVLVGVEGAEANVLKIRPPLLFRNEHADQLVDALDATLDEFDA